MSLHDLVGSRLIGKDGKTLSTATDVTSKVVMLYFSAHWCPPCRGFTPALAEWYTTQKSKGVDLEIIFISSDRDQASFNEYYSEMPWLALPFAELDVKNKLSKKLKVSGIPTLVLANQDGVVYNKDGRTIVMEDPNGMNYPWLPPTLEEALGTTFIRNDGTEVKLSDLKGNYIALSFSATWCPPCQAFFPTMKEAYENVNATQKKWEVIFVSSDRSQGDFDNYFAKMPWLAVPFQDRHRKNLLSEFFQVEGIPTLIQLGPNLEVVNKALRGPVTSDISGNNFPWLPKPVQSLEEGAEDINEVPALLALMEDETDTTQAQLEAILAELAESHKADKARDEALFLVTKAPGGMADHVRELTGTHNNGQAIRTLCNGDMCIKLKNTTCVVILDIPDNGGFYTLTDELSRENILKFWEDFLGGNLTSQRQQLE